MEATSGARFHVLTVIVAALIGGAGCASAESGGEAATPSETMTQSPSQTIGSLPDTVQEPLEDALVSIRGRYQVFGAAVTVTTPEGTWSMVHRVADLEAQDPVVSDMAWPYAA